MTNVKDNARTLHLQCQLVSQFTLPIICINSGGFRGGGEGAMALGLALFMPKKGLALLPPPPPPMHLSECPKVFGKMSQNCPRCPRNGFN